MYSIHDGKVNDLNISVNNDVELQAKYSGYLKRIYEEKGMTYDLWNKLKVLLRGEKVMTQIRPVEQKREVFFRKWIEKQIIVEPKHNETHII